MWYFILTPDPENVKGTPDPENVKGMPVWNLWFFPFSVALIVSGLHSILIIQFQSCLLSIFLFVFYQLSNVCILELILSFWFFNSSLIFYDIY